MPLVEARTGLKRHRPPHEVVDADNLLLVARADGGAAGVAVPLQLNLNHLLLHDVALDSGTTIFSFPRSFIHPASPSVLFMSLQLPFPEIYLGMES